MPENSELDAAQDRNDKEKSDEYLLKSIDQHANLCIDGNSYRSGNQNTQDNVDHIDDEDDDEFEDEDDENEGDDELGKSLSDVSKGVPHSAQLGPNTVSGTRPAKAVFLGGRKLHDDIIFIDARNTSNPGENISCSNEIIGVPMPNFERLYRNHVLRPLLSNTNANATTNQSSDSSDQTGKSDLPVINENIIAAVSILRTVMRAMYFSVSDLYSSQKCSMGVNDNHHDGKENSKTRFQDSSAEEVTRLRLLPHTIRNILLLRSEDATGSSSSSSRRNNTLRLDVEKDIVFLNVLLDFAELSALLFQISNTRSRNLNVLDHLGTEWMEALLLAFGNNHYWEWSEDDWKGNKTSDTARCANTSTLPCYYYFAGHTSLGQTFVPSSSLNPRHKNKIVVKRTSLLPFSSSEKRLSGDNDFNNIKEDVINTARIVEFDEYTSSISSFLIAVLMCFLRYEGLNGMTNLLRCGYSRDKLLRCGDTNVHTSENLENEQNKYIRRASLASAVTCTNIVRALTSTAWIATACSDDSLPTLISKFREATFEYVQTLSVGVDVVSGEDRRILFSLLDSFCNEYPHPMPQNRFVHFLVFDFESYKLRLNAIWKLLCDENTNLQGRIFGLNELRNRIIDAVQKYEEVKCRNNIQAGVVEHERNLIMPMKISTPLSSDNSNKHDMKEYIDGVLRMQTRTSSSLNSEKLDDLPQLELSNSLQHSPSYASSNGDIPEEQNGNMIVGISNNANIVMNSVDDDDPDIDNQGECITISSLQTNLIGNPSINRNSPLTSKDQSVEAGTPSILEAAGQEINYLISFLTKEHSFLKTFLSPSYLHPELLKRSTVVPSFLAENGALTSTDVSIIWSTAMTSRHESVQNAVYELLIALLEKLNEEQIFTLGDKLAAFRPEAVHEKFLLLVYNFSKASLGLMEKKNSDNPLSLQLLWDLAEDCRPFQKAIHETAVSHLHSLTSYIFCSGSTFQSLAASKMSSSEFQNNLQRTKIWLLEKAISSIQEGRNSITCQLILSNILRLWPIDESAVLQRRKVAHVSSNESSGGDVISSKFSMVDSSLPEIQPALNSSIILLSRMQIIKKYDLVTLVVDDICRYARKYKESGGDNANEDAALNHNFYSHIVCISSRLEFLKFILNFCFNSAAMEEQNTNQSNKEWINVADQPALKSDEKDVFNISEKISSSDVSSNAMDMDNLPVLKLPKIKSIAEVHNASTMMLDQYAQKSNDKKAPSVSSNPIVIEDDDDGITYKTEPDQEETRCENSRSSPQDLSKANITYISNNSRSSSHDTFYLTTKHIDLLWSTLIENRMDPDTDYCFQALSSILVTSEICFSKRIYLATTLFQYCLERLQAKSMRSSSFDLFALSMSCCNIIEGRYEPFSHDGVKERYDDVGTNILLGYNQSLSVSGNLLGSNSFLFDKSQVQVRIKNFEILGINKLWEIALYATDEEVAKRSILILSTIYTFQHVTPALHGKVAMEQRRFVQCCMATLVGGKNSVRRLNGRNNVNIEIDMEAPANVPILRCLKLIATFTDKILKDATCKGVLVTPSISDLRNEYYPMISHGYTTSALFKKMSSGVFNYYHIRVQPPYGTPSFEVKCRQGTSVGCLRQVVRERISLMPKINSCLVTQIEGSTLKENKENHAEEIPRPDYRLIHRGRELIDDDTLLTSYGISEDVVVHCWPRMQTKAALLSLRKSTKGHDNKKDTTNDREKKIMGGNQRSLGVHDSSFHVSKMLEKPELAAVSELIERKHIAELFSLLDKVEGCGNQDCEIQGLVWDLLQLLPTDPLLKLELNSLKQCKLNDEMKMEIDSSNELNQCDLEHFLPSNVNTGSCFRLLYALQVVEYFVAEAVEKYLIEPVKDGYEIKGRKLTWSRVFSESDGVHHLIKIYIKVDLSFEKKHFEKKQQLSSILFLLRCTHHLQQLLIYFFGETTEDNIVFDNLEQIQSLLCHITAILHWSVNIQKCFWIQKPLRESSSNKMIRDDITVNFCEDTGFHSTSMASNLIKNSTNTNSWSGSCSNSSFNAGFHQGKKVQMSIEEELCFESCLVARQSLSLLRLVSSTDSNLVNVFFSDSFKHIDQSKSTTLFSNALASAFVQSPSDDIRRLAFNTFRSMFLLRSEIQLSSSVETKSRTLKLCSMMASLLPLGRKNDLIDRCDKLFDLVCHILSAVWKAATPLEKHEAIADVDGIFTRITFSETYEFCNEVTFENKPPFIHNAKDIGKLLNWVCIEIFASPIREERRRANVDSYLVGLLSLAIHILKMLGKDAKQKYGVDQSKFIHHIYYSCLYLQPSALNNGPLSPPKCKTLESREAALALISTLCEESSNNVMVVMDLLQKSHHVFTKDSTPRMDLVNEWHFDPLARDKGMTGHVGLRNLGATCYLNSLLQQLFLIKAFRNGILSCKTNELSSQEESNTGLLHQLQLLFANLLLSERRDYDTSGLCASIKGYDGNSIRPGEQQDVVEFFNLFGDRLETILKPLPQKQLLQDVFGGQLCHVIICQECKHRSERLEDCLSLSLDVKGKSNIAESLNLYIQGEALDGDNQYYCEKCQAKQDSLKMCCVKTLPNVLVLHLKRFEFDLEIMRKIKVNDKFEYPKELNMKAYTKEANSHRILGTDSSNSASSMQDHAYLKNLPDSYYNYYLRGVLVHSGTADSGHYYSLACENIDLNGKKQEPWFCFNDSCVTPFDPSTLPAATFGGTKVASRFDHVSQKMIRTETPKSYSAYLLIYERKYIGFKENHKFDTKQDHGNTFSEIQKFDQNKESLELTELNLNRPWFQDMFSDVSYFVPKKIFEALWIENDRFLRDQILFSPEYCTWLLELSKICTSSEDVTLDIKMAPIQILAHFLFDNLIHGKDLRSQCESIISILCKWCSENEKACSWILQMMSNSFKFWCEKILLHCPVVDVRRDFVRFLSVLFRKIVPFERNSYICENQNEQKMYKGKQDGETILKKKSCTYSVYVESDNESDEEVCDFDDFLLQKSVDLEVSRYGLNILRIGRAKWWSLSKPTLIQFVGSALLMLLRDCEKHWRRFDQLFEAIMMFASCGQKECIYLIRCGLILRYIDLYLGDGGCVPKKSLTNTKTTSWSITHNIRPRMGDKYCKPNMYPLLATLDLLVRSALMPDCENDCDDDSDFHESDDGSANAEVKKSQDTKETNELKIPSTLAASAMFELKDQSICYELPKRDAALISSTRFWEALLEEPSIMTKSIEFSTINYNSSTFSENKECPSVGNGISMNRTIVSTLVCHLCFNNIALTESLCDVALRLMKDRKADEFVLALEASFALLQLDDDYVDDRINLVMEDVIRGIMFNLKYEKEGTLIINGLRCVLSERTGGSHGTEPEVKLHNWILSRVEGDLCEWFKKPNTSGEIRQSIIGLIASLLPIEPIDSISEPTPKINSQMKRSRNHVDNENTKKMKIINENNQIEAAAGKSGNSFNINCQLHSSGKSSSDAGKCDDEVILIGVVNTNSAKNASLVKSNDLTSGLQANYTDKPSIFHFMRNYNNHNFMPGYKSHQWVKRKLLSCLISLFEIVNDAVQSQATSAHYKANPRNLCSGSMIHDQQSRNFYIDSSILANYFETVRHCLVGSAFEEEFLYCCHGGIHQRLISLLWKIDEEGRSDQRPSADIAKGEIIILYEKMIRLHPNLREELVNNFVIPFEKRNDDNKHSDDIDVDLKIDEWDSSDDSVIEMNAKKLRKGRKMRKKQKVSNNKHKHQEQKNQECIDIDIDAISKILEIYVTSIPENDWYNNKYISHYYSILLHLADSSEAFKRKMLDHDNWRWSLKAFILGPSGRASGALSKIVFDGSMRYIEEDIEFRNMLIVEMLAENYDGNRNSLITQPRLEPCTFRLLSKALHCADSEENGMNAINVFVENKEALSQLSVAVNKFHKALENGGSQNVGTNVLLECLSLTLDCLFTILNSFGLNKIRDLMKYWTEVDDINFLCCQLVTQSSEEWEKYIEKDREGEGRVECMRAVESASSISKILASVDAIQDP